VSSSLVLVSEDTGGLHDIVGTSLGPWDLLRVPNESQRFKHQFHSYRQTSLGSTVLRRSCNIGLPDAEDSNCLLAEEESLVVLELDVAVLPVAVHGVVLEHVGLHITE
jgi:hypothetical protein